MLINRNFYNLKKKKKRWSWPCDRIASGDREKNQLIGKWILQNERDEKGAVGGREGDNKQGGTTPARSDGFSSFPNGGPVLNSVVNLWGFCWGVWRPSGSLGVGSGSWRGLKEEGRGSNWLCAEGSVCWRGRCGGLARERRWGRPPLWGPGGTWASVEDCHLEGSLNCFLKRREHLRRDKKTRGATVSLCRKRKKFAKQTNKQTKVKVISLPKKNRRNHNV